MKEFSATTGQPLPEDDAAVESDAMRTLELAHIVPSLTNPRKNFDPARLQELADSIKASGVHQPILVRPLPGSRVDETSWYSDRGRHTFLPHRDVRPTHELVAGERRYRASQIAGKTTIPALIRTLTDEQVLEIQIVENLQRDDLTELEEAEGYEQLMQRANITAEAVGAKIGKSRSYVYGRLKLLDLSLESKEALRTGQIDASRAILIARIPDGKLQAKALAEATRKSGYLEEVPSVRELQRWLQANVMLRLDNAPFKITDARLVPAAGSCKDCPKRTGANPDLFADVQGADICTDPTCFNAKADAHRAQLMAKAEAKGMRVIEGKEAHEIFPTHGTGIMKGYTMLSQVRMDCGDGGDGRPPSLRELLGKDAPAPVLIEHPFTKELIEAVPSAEAEALLLAKGLIKATQAEKETGQEISILKDSIEQRTVREGNAAMFRALVDAVHATPEAGAHALVGVELVRAWLVEQCDIIDTKDLASALNVTVTADTNEDQLRMAAQRMPSHQLWKALAIMMIIDDQQNVWSTRKETPLYAALAPAIGVNLTAVLRDTRVAIKGEVNAKINALKAEAAPKIATKTTSAHEPAAPPEVGTGGGKPKKAGGPAVPARKRMSPEEATTGIAAAMQGIEPAATARPAGQEGFAVGQRVRVTADTDKLGPILAKWGGKEGTVIHRSDDGTFLDVTFKGRNGGIAMFEVELLEAVEVAA